MALAPKNYARTISSPTMTRQYDEEKIPTAYNVYDDIPGNEVGPGVVFKTFRGLDILANFVIAEPDRDSEPNPHSHPWEQVAFAVQGSYYFTVDGERVHMEEGDILVVPPGVEHYGEPDPENDKTMVNLDIFPLREDYLKNTDYQEEFPNPE